MTDAGVSPADSGGLLSLMLPSLCSTENEADGLGYYGDQNLFRRIIRNPNPYGRLPKERECAEMLCGCLINMPVFQTAFLSQMAELANQIVPFEEMEFRFRTEQPIWGKRDDLRIEGFDNQGVRKLLWSVEIKVGAGFHYSYSTNQGDSSEHEKKTDEDAQEEELTRKLVNQLKNYDDWLSKQKVDYKAGFVLSIWDQKNHLPNSLAERWYCMTWQDIGRWLGSFIEDKKSVVEGFLARQLLGFIEQALGGKIVDNKLSLEDIGLLKAFYLNGQSSIQNLRNIVSSVATNFENSGPLPFELKRDDFFKFHVGQGILQTFWWPFQDPREGDWPCLCAGITSKGGLDIIVYISTKPSHSKKEEIRELLDEKFKDLILRDPRWNSFISEPSFWWDIEHRVPLEKLLCEEDQVEWMENHFRKVFKDLEAVGIIKGIQEIVT